MRSLRKEEITKLRKMAISKEDILEAVSSMSVLDLSELIKEMEEKFGVSFLIPDIPG